MVCEYLSYISDCGKPSSLDTLIINVSKIVVQLIVEGKAGPRTPKTYKEGHCILPREQTQEVVSQIPVEVPEAAPGSFPLLQLLADAFLIGSCSGNVRRFFSLTGPFTTQSNAGEGEDQDQKGGKGFSGHDVQVGARAMPFFRGLW